MQTEEEILKIKKVKNTAVPIKKLQNFYNDVNIGHLLYSRF